MTQQREAVVAFQDQDAQLVNELIYIGSMMVCSFIAATEGRMMAAEALKQDVVKRIVWLGDSVDRAQMARVFEAMRRWTNALRGIGEE